MNISFKIILVGEGYVGKTSLRRSYMGNYFKKQYIMTIGADFSSMTHEIDDHRVTVNIWDLAGQDHFKALRESYYRGASGAILVYNIVNRDTFVCIDKWIKEVFEETGKKVPLIMVANKADLVVEGEDYVTREEATAYLEKVKEEHTIDIQYVETSALTGSNVQDAFKALTGQLYNDFVEKYITAQEV